LKKHGEKVSKDIVCVRVFCIIIRGAHNTCPGHLPLCSVP
jgi:hypothetical protein